MGKIKEYVRKIKDYMESQDLKGKKSFLAIFIDIVFCTIRYGATISDYFIYRFYSKKGFERKKYMTAKDKNRFYEVMNDKQARTFIQNKDVFNENFAEFIKRDSIATPDCGEEEFYNFLKNHPVVFIKPVATGGGFGVEKVYVDAETNFADLWKQTEKKGKCVVEAGIVQHHALAEIHPQSINSVRVATLYFEDRVDILFAELRCGTGDNYVDNHMSGGITMQVDVEEGKVSSRASSKKSLNIIRHPDTGVFLPGFQIPHWDKCIELVKSAAQKVNGIRYVGWDLAIMEDDVCLIEANPSGDFNIYQESIQAGCKEEMDEIIDKVKNAQKNGI